MHGLMSMMHFIQTTTGNTLDRLAELGPMGLLLWLVGEKVIPAGVRIIRPEQDRRAKRELTELERVKELEMRQISAWESVAQSNNQLAQSNGQLANTMAQLASAMASMDQRNEIIQTGMVTLLERTAGCEARNLVRGSRKKEVQGD